MSDPIGGALYPDQRPLNLAGRPWISTVF